MTPRLFLLYACRESPSFEFVFLAHNKAVVVNTLPGTQERMTKYPWQLLKTSFC